MDVVTALLRAGAHVSARDSAGGTPLHASTLHGHVETVRVLLQAGADCNAVDHGGNTPLHALTRAHSDDKTSATLASLLLEYGASADFKNSEDLTPASAALAARNMALVKACRDFFGEEQATISTGVYEKSAMNNKDVLDQEKASRITTHGKNINRRRASQSMTTPQVQQQSDEGSGATDEIDVSPGTMAKRVTGTSSDVEATVKSSCDRGDYEEGAELPEAAHLKSPQSGQRSITVTWDRDRSSGTNKEDQHKVARGNNVEDSTICQTIGSTTDFAAEPSQATLPSSIIQGNETT